MIETFIDSALIIDDKPAEVENLKKELEKKQILHIHYLPENLLKSPLDLKNRKLIFLDLYIDETKSKLEEQVSLIRKLFKESVKNTFGTYGIVLWTKHQEDFQAFVERFFNNNNDYKLPLFIVCLDKTKYLKANNFDTLLADLDAELEKNLASNFFINWYNSVNKGRDNAIHNIYSLCGNYKDQESNLRYALFLLAQNHTGIPIEDIEKDGYPIHHDSFKAFNSMLEYEINSIANYPKNFLEKVDGIKYLGKGDKVQEFSVNVKNSLFQKETVISRDKGKFFANKTEINSDLVKLFEQEVTFVKSAINTKMHLDITNLDKATLLPGNIYQVLDEKSTLYMKEAPTSATRIVIEITPPCDYAQKKRLKPRFVSGVICDYPERFNGSHFYTEIKPIQIDPKESTRMLVFDFRYLSTVDESSIKDEKQFKLLFKAKDKFFADLLQKFSSHTARLGLAIIH